LVILVVCYNIAVIMLDSLQK